MLRVLAVRTKEERGVMKLGIWTRLVPPLLLVGGGIAVLTVSIPSARSDQQQQAQLRSNRQTLESIRLLVDSNEAATQLQIARWKTALGRDADLEPLRNDLARSLEALQRGPSEIANAFVDGIPEMAEPAFTTTAKNEMGVVGEIGAQTAEAINRLALDIGRPQLEAEASLIHRVSDLDEFVTSTRVVRGIDPAAAEPDAQTYLAGLVSSLGSVPDPYTRLDELLTGREAPPEFDGEPFAVVSLEPDVAQWIAEVRWALMGGRDDSSGLGATELDQLSAQVARRVSDVVDDKITAESAELVTLADDAGHAAMRWLIAALLAALSVIAGLVLGVLGLRKALRKLRLASELDELTGLVNRVGLRSRTEPWLAPGRSGPVGVSVLDLDDFKSINDNYGHEAGDRVLDALAKRVSTNVVHSSTSVGRWGGDEFVIVFKLADGDGPAEVARMNGRLIRAVREPFDLGPAVVALSASIGSSVCACGNCNFDDLFREADRRLYDVKRSNGNGTAVGECRSSVSESEPVVTATSFGEVIQSS
jgi:diguanylate cyclase (GGDEF)-like protein